MHVCKPENHSFVNRMLTLCSGVLLDWVTGKGSTFAWFAGGCILAALARAPDHSYGAPWPVVASSYFKTALKFQWGMLERAGHVIGGAYPFRLLMLIPILLLPGGT